MAQHQKKLRLTRMVASSGCAAKLSPSNLSKTLCGLPIRTHPRLLVGLEKPDDAGVYKLSPRLALIQTVDFFPPIVDDPYTFGQIAAANALSDIYAMGGQPITAMNVVGFPTGKLDSSVLKEILRGGLNKLQETEALLVGGHSINDAELKYGLAVTGIVHPKKIITNSTARPGDKLILTKPIGTGVITTALKAGRAPKKSVRAAVRSMSCLNRDASAVMQRTGAHACTDVTGFSLIGHAYIMAANSRVGIVIHHSTLPYLPAAESLARQGFIPGGTWRNKEFYSPHVRMTDNLPAGILDLLFDPQTSGGLLIAVPPHKTRLLLNRLKAKGIKDARIIGEVIKEPKGQIVVE